jgi:hypothetical protein
MQKTARWRLARHGDSSPYLLVEGADIVHRGQSRYGRKCFFGGTLDGDEEDMITRWDNNHEIVRNSTEV